MNSADRSRKTYLDWNMYERKRGNKVRKRSKIFGYNLQRLHMYRMLETKH